MADLPARMAVSLLLTIALELAFALLLRKRGRDALLLVVLVNILTNPAVVYLYTALTVYANWPPVPCKLVLEVAAVLIEGRVYASRGQYFQKPHAFSLGANAVSFFSGELLNIIV